MRILTFTSLFPSSCDPTHAIFVYQRCAHLARRPDNEVIVVSPVPYFPSWLKTNRWRTASQVPTEERIGSLTVYHPRYFLLPKIFMTLHAVSMFLGCRPEVARLNERAKLDCIDAHFVYPDGLAAVLLGKFLGVPVIVSARGSDIHAYPAFRTIRPMIRWTLQHADALIAVSASLKKSMIELGASADKIHVIPNGIDPVRFQPVPISQARQELNLPVDAPFIVSVGALIPSKGHQFLVRAFGRIAGRHPDMRLAILGEGPLRSQLDLRRGRIGKAVAAGQAAQRGVAAVVQCSDRELSGKRRRRMAECGDGIADLRHTRRGNPRGRHPGNPPIFGVRSLGGAVSGRHRCGSRRSAFAVMGSRNNLTADTCTDLGNGCRRSRRCSPGSGSWARAVIR